MKKAMLWVKILSAAAAVCGVMNGVSSVTLRWEASASLDLQTIFSLVFSVLPAVLLLAYACWGRPLRPAHPLLTFAAAAAAISCAYGIYADIRSLGATVQRIAPPRGAVGILGWVIRGGGVLLQLVGLILFLWVAADSLRGLKGLKTGRTLGSVYAGLQGIRCIVYIWTTVVSLTDSRGAAADAVPSGLLLASNLSGILAILCFAAAWTILVWGGLKRENTSV